MKNSLFFLNLSCYITDVGAKMVGFVTAFQTGWWGSGWIAVYARHIMKPVVDRQRKGSCTPVGGCRGMGDEQILQEHAHQRKNNREEPGQEKAWVCKCGWKHIDLHGGSNTVNA